MREILEPFASLSLALMRGGPPPLACFPGLAGGHKRSVVTARGLKSVQQAFYAALLGQNAGGLSHWAMADLRDFLHVAISTAVMWSTAAEVT